MRIMLQSNTTMSEGRKPVLPNGIKPLKEDLDYIRGTGVLFFHDQGKKRICVVDKKNNSNLSLDRRYDLRLCNQLRQYGVRGVVLVYTMSQLIAVEQYQNDNRMTNLKRSLIELMVQRHCKATGKRGLSTEDWGTCCAEAERELVAFLTRDEIYTLNHHDFRQLLPSRHPVVLPKPKSEVGRRAENNVGCIFQLEEIGTGERLQIHLRRLAEDVPPILPEGCDSVGSDAALGEILLKYEAGKEQFVCNGIQYRVIQRDPYKALALPKLETQLNQIENIDVPDQAKHADGHMAREGGRWGSFPMHDHYGDESTGQERDYEDLEEYVAHYA